MASEAQEVGNDIQAWRVSATHLINAAEILRQYEDSQKLTFLAEWLLWGCAVEVLLKALYLKKGCMLYEGGKLKPEFRTHNLVCMAQKVGFPLPPGRQEIMRTLTLAVTWASRYPAPSQGDLESVTSAKWDDLDSLIKDLVAQIS